MAENRDASLRARRQEIVDEHIEGENSGNPDAVVASFYQPRYEIVPMNAVVEGGKPVRDFVASIIVSFPNFHFEAMTTHHAEHAVIVEGRITGTHQAEWAGIPAKGNKLNVPLICIFDFDGERLINEKLYFDFGEVQRQLRA